LKKHSEIKKLGKNYEGRKKGKRREGIKKYFGWFSYTCTVR